MSDSPSIVDMYLQMEDERVDLVAWLLEQHAKAADAFDKHDEEYDLALTAAYRRVLERLGEKP